MLSSKIFNSKAARSIFYIIFVSGLFFLISISCEFFCNQIMAKCFDLPEITLLESAGVFAFVYIVYHGIKFGTNKISNSPKDSMPNMQDNANMAANETLKTIQNLTQEQKEQLKSELAKKCGIQQKYSKGPSS